MPTVADPGFPRGGGANSPGGAPTYDFAEISQKLHEIERIWTPGGGGARPLRPPLDPPLAKYYSFECTRVMLCLKDPMQLNY